MRFRTNLVLYALAVVLAIALTAACSIPTVPDQIQIKASPTYNVPAGATTITLSDHFDLDEELIAELQTELGEDGIASGSVVNYGDDDIYTIFASYIPVSLNTADFFNEEVDLVDSVNQTIDPITFTVPDINETSTVEENIDPIALPASVSLPSANISGITEVPGAVVTLEDGSSIEISTDTFDTVTFDQGSLQAAMNFTGLSGTVIVTISNVAIVNPNDSYSVIANADQASQDATAASPSPTFTFPLAGVELPNTIAFSMTLSIDSGGDSGTFDVDITPSFTGSPTLQAATGVNFDVTQSGDKLLEIEDPDFVYATIGAGTLGADISLPPGWSGITVDLELSVYQAADTSSNLVSSDDNLDGSVSLNLAGLQIGEGATGPTLGWEYTITGSNASFSISDVDPEATITNTVAITNFTDLTVVADELDLSANEVSENYIIDQEIIDMVNSITFVTSELQFTVNNGLPFDVTIDATSNILSGGTDSLTFTSGNNGTQTMEIVDSLDLDDTSGTYSLLSGITDSEGNTGDGIHMEFSFDINSYDEGTQRLTLTSVNPGEEYTFSGSVTAQLDINEIDVTNVQQDGTFPEDGGDPIDLSMLDDYLPSDINIDQTNASTNMVISGPADEMSMDVVLLARYTHPGDSVPSIDVLIGTGDPATLGFDPLAYTGEPADTLSSTSDVDESLPFDLLAILNNRPTDLELAYNVNVDGLTVPVASDPTDISASLDMVIPLALSVGDDTETYPWVPDGDTTGWNEITIPDPDIQDELSVDTDLLDREVIPDEDISDILNNLTEASIHLDLVNEMFREAGVDGGYNILIRVVDGDYNAGDDTYEFDKYIDFSTGDHELSLGPNEIDYIKNNAFTPEIKLYLKEGTLRFNPDAELSLSMWLRVRTDVDYTFELGEEE